MKHFVKRGLSILLVGILSVGLAACGGNGNGGGAAAATPTPTPQDTAPAERVIVYSQGANDYEVLIANSAAASGPLAFVGLPFLGGMRAYLDMINAGGGIDGRTIRLLHTDDEFDPVRGMAALQGFVEDDRVFAIVGHMGTPVVAATLADLKEYGIPAVYFATGIRDLYSANATTNATGRNIFPVQPLFVTEGKILTAFAAGKFGATRIGIIYTNDDAGLDMYEGAREQIALMPGVEYVSVMVAAGAPDVSAAVTTIRNADVDFIIAASIQVTLPTIINELAAQGVNIPVITSYVNTDVSMSAALVDNIYGRFDVFSTGWLDLEAAAAGEDIELFNQWIADEFMGNAFAQAGWIASSVFVEGLRRIEGEDITWDNYIAAMERGPITIPFGGSVNFENAIREGVQEMTLSRIVPISEEHPMGFEMVAPLTNMNDLLRDLVN